VMIATLPSNRPLVARALIVGPSRCGAARAERRMTVGL
jgi:hypothetical protein